MNKDFKVLIIEDDTDFSDDLKQQLDEYLLENQLIPQIITNTRFDQIDCERIGNKFDLIIVDYNLPNDMYGTSFISKIRESSLLPDIIFYSSTSSIKEIIENEDKGHREPILNLLQKGIYFSNSEKMTDTAKQVILKIILREEKANGFAGLVLSSVAEYESMVNDILMSLINIIPLDKQKSITDYCHKSLQDLEKRAGKQLQDFTNIPDLSNLFVDKNRLLDHNRRTMIMNHILGELGYTKIDFERYVSEVLRLRNSLGHVACEQSNGEEYYSIVCNGEIIQLTPEYCKEKRKLLIEWKNQFQSIVNIIQDSK